MGYRDFPSLGEADEGRRVFTREVTPTFRARSRAHLFHEDEEDEVGESPELLHLKEKYPHIKKADAKATMDWEKKLLGPGAMAGDRVWGIYNIRGTTGEGSYPEGSPEFFDDDFTLTGGDDGVVPPGQPVAFHPPGHPQEGLLKLRDDITPIASHGPGVAREYGRLTRAVQRNDSSLKTGIGWSGHYRAPGRDRELYSDERHRNVGPVGDSALDLAILNKEQRGFTFSSEAGSAAYAEEQEAFKHEGWRKSYVESGGSLSPLPDECVELVSMTPRGPIYTSSNLPGCP